MSFKPQAGGIDPPSEQNFICHDFETVRSAVLETDRGRWFLGEYSRRHRSVESAEILTALDRLTRRVLAYESFLGQMANGRGARIEISHATPQPEPVYSDLTPRRDLGERLAALQEIDALDAEAKLKLFA